MKLFLIAILTIHSVGPVCGQLVLTKSDNENWIKQLREQTIPERLQTIRSRILADTNVYIQRIDAHYGPLPIPEKDRNKAIGLCKPLMILDGKQILPGPAEPIKILSFVQVLTLDNIKLVEIAEDKYASVLYGEQGLCGGVILLTAIDKKSKKKILRFSR